MALFEIIVGTYEQFLLGFKCVESEGKYKLVRSFVTRSHMASIRCIAKVNNYLATGGHDEAIYLYDMNTRKEVGKLTHHQGTVNTLAFTPDGTHLLSGGSDGSLVIVRCGNWQIEKYWNNAHKGSAVNAVALHRSAKIAFSSGGDGVLRTWNLVKGRLAYATNLVPRHKLDAKYIDLLMWSPNGGLYVVACGKKLDVYNTATAGGDDALTFEAKIISMDFVNPAKYEKRIAVGLEDGTMVISEIDTKEVVVEHKLAHDRRIKCLKCWNDFIITASSAGEIKLWKLDDNKLKLLATTTCDARITCMTIF